jgi:hypothetical protein
MRRACMGAEINPTLVGVHGRASWFEACGDFFVGSTRYRRGAPRDGTRCGGANLSSNGAVTERLRQRLRR